MLGAQASRLRSQLIILTLKVVDSCSHSHFVLQFSPAVCALVDRATVGPQPLVLVSPNKGTDQEVRKQAVSGDLNTLHFER